MRIEVWSDVICPWCYIADARFTKVLDEFAHPKHVEVVHRSFELDPGHDAAHVEPLSEYLGRRFGAQGAVMEDRVAALARQEGLPYRTDRRVGSTLDAHRLLQLAKEEGRQLRLLALLFDTNFGKAESIFARDALLKLAIRAGLDQEEARRVLDQPGAYLDAVRADERAATELGARSVPFYVIDGRYALTGAQPVSTFRAALQDAWAHGHVGNPRG